MNLGKIGMSDTSYKTKLKDMFTHNDDKCYTTTERRDKYVGCICQKGWFFISLTKSSFKTIEIFYLQCLVFIYN